LLYLVRRDILNLQEGRYRISSNLIDLELVRVKAWSWDVLFYFYLSRVTCAQFGFQGELAPIMAYFFLKEVSSGTRNNRVRHVGLAREENFVVSLPTSSEAECLLAHRFSSVQKN
jgi:hypothetical protein